MKKEDELLIQVSDLFFLVNEGLATDAQEQLLAKLLLESEAARKLYLDLVVTCVGLSDAEGLFGLNKSFNPEVWEELAAYELTAEAVEVPKPAEPEYPVKKLEVVKQPRQINKFSLYTSIISTAAFIFLLLLVRYLPQQPSSQRVGVIGDLRNPVSYDSQQEFAAGDEIFNETLMLKEGYLDIHLDSGAKVILAGPVEVNFNNINSLSLAYGDVVVNIENGPTGYSVITPNGSVVDYGTEFGVSVDFMGQTQIEVFQGLVDLRNSTNPQVFESSQKVSAGQIGQIDTDGRIKCRDKQGANSRFVRTLVVPKPAKGLPVYSTVDGVLASGRSLRGKLSNGVDSIDYVIENVKMPMIGDDPKFDKISFNSEPFSWNWISKDQTPIPESYMFDLSVTGGRKAAFTFSTAGMDGSTDIHSKFIITWGAAGQARIFDPNGQLSVLHNGDGYVVFKRVATIKNLPNLNTNWKVTTGPTSNLTFQWEESQDSLTTQWETIQISSFEIVQ